LIDKPIIQYIVEELVEAGIEDIVIVTGYHKRSIEDHFDHMSTDLQANLKQGNKLDLLDETRKISDLANFAYVRQKGPYGNATPLLNAEHLIGHEPFIYTYADDLMIYSPNHFQQMIDYHTEFGATVLSCMRIDKADDYKRYGVVGGKAIRPGVVQMSTIVEKPGKKAAPSNLASVAGYLLTPDLFEYLHADLEQLKPGIEFQVQPAMRAMIAKGKKLYACEIAGGQYYDTGNKLDYIKTVVDFALTRNDMKSELEQYLRDKLL
jgi:UTP--glucose-1-phosphate uridylyltransferase